MALNFLSGNGNGSSAKFFDIRLDNDYIVFRGGEDEAASAQVQGSVVLCLVEPLTVKHVKLTLSGINRISLYFLHDRQANHLSRTDLFEKSWTFRDPGKNKTEILKPDNYEFPFDVVLEGALPESVEGLSDSWVIYRFKAEIGRKYAKDIVVRKPLRIVRTPDASALELSHAMVDFRLVPLLKGLIMGLVSIQVKEEQELVVDPDFGVSSTNTMQKFERVVARDEYIIDTEADAQILDEQAEGYQFSRYLELPKSLNRCLQDCNVKGIKVRHRLKFNIQLHNPDGHISELRANLPVSFYISPNFPINENNDLVDQSPHIGRLTTANDLQSAPPLYGEHQFDQLYSEVDPSGYRTPGNFSTPGTPTHTVATFPLTISPLDAITHTTGLSTSPGNGQVSAAALQSRLQNLRLNGAVIPSPLIREASISGAADTQNDGEISRTSSSHSNPDEYFTSRSSSNNHSRGHTPPNQQHHIHNAYHSVPGSANISRRPSAEGSAALYAPRAQFFHAEDLTRVPSYTTAVRTPISRLGISTGLPSYAATTSTVTAHSVPTEPPSAHLRNEGGPGRVSPASRNISILHDEERRLRLLQARGR